MREQRTATPLVGRDDELARAVGLAAMPEVGAVLFTGPSGIGTSRMAEGTLTELVAQGWRGVGITATAPAGDIPFAALSELVPGTLDGIEGVPAEMARLRVLRALEDALDLGQTAPVVVVLDDVATVDPPSCELLVHLAANRRLFLAASQRNGSELSEATRRLAPARPVIVDLEPLDLTATAHLAAQVLGGPVGPGLVRAVWTKTEGVPLYVGDLLGSAVATGRVRAVDDVFQLSGELEISPSLARQLVFRLGLTTRVEHQVLELLALAGALGVDDLTSVCDIDALEVMEQRGLLRTEEHGLRERVTLCHPMHAEAIAAGMTPLARRRRSGELAELLERHGLPRRDDRVLHLRASLAAGRGPETDDLVAGALDALAGDRIHDATQLAEAAHAADPSTETRMTLAEARIRAGRFVEADELLATTGAHPGTDEWTVLRHAIRRSSNALWGFRDAEAALAIDANVRPALTDPDALARLAAHEAWIDYCAGRSVAALDRTENLAAALDQAGHPDVRFAVAVARAPALVLTGRVVAGADLAREAWERGWGEGNRDGSHAQHLIALGFGLLYQGDLDAAAFVAGEAVRTCRETNQTPPLLFFLDLGAWIELHRGDLVTASSYFDESLAIATELSLGTALRLSLAGAVSCHAQRGDADAARSTLARLDDVPSAPDPRAGLDVDRAVAWVEIVDGRPEEGAEHLRRLARRTDAAGLRTMTLLTAFDLARIGRASPDDAELAEQAATSCEGPLLATLGRAVRAAADDDAPMLDDASSTLAGLGLRLWASELAAAASDAWARRGEQRSATASQRASDTHRRGGAPEATTPALARRQAVEPLTTREREVASLAARGLSNADMAAQLHLSVRTVETHLSRIYGKLGVAGRRELADALDDS